ncbi:MAG: hypothetical protein CMP23_06930 [Rickettsiales bacterium]|nr:hypothetical protein [Rickettsiales bacterium]|tara:strand:+ start:2899 stop:3675 length:777 start_codon:yes stop_codon:yes gene_type:complete
MKPTLILSLALALSGCSEIDDYFSTVAAQALFIGLDDPSSAQSIGLDPALANGATATVFLAKARSLESISANLFDDADSVSISDSTTSVTLSPRGNGLYSVDSGEDEALSYVIGRSYSIDVYEEGRLHSAEMLAPPPPSLTGIPDAQAGSTHPAGSELQINMGQQFDNYLVLVSDESGSITYSNRPEEVSDYLDWIGGSSVFTTITVPGSAFPASGTGYIVAVAGIRRASDSAFDNFNPLVSNLAMGSLAVSPVVTSP